MATNQPQLTLPQLNPNLLNTLMNTFAQQAASSKEDERALMDMFDPRAIAKREMEGALAMAEIEKSRGQLGLDTKRLALDEKLGFAELEGLNKYRDVQALLESINLSNQRVNNFMQNVLDPYWSQRYMDKRDGKPTGVSELFQRYTALGPSLFSGHGGNITNRAGVDPRKGVGIFGLNPLTSAITGGTGDIDFSPENFMSPKLLEADKTQILLDSLRRDANHPRLYGDENALLR